MIQTVIQHDPRRADLLPPLLATLPDAQVVPDPEPESPIRSPWRTYLACLRVLDPDASHLLILQDDAELCRDFAATVELVVAARPDRPICLFVPGVGLMAREVLEACRRGSHWFELNNREWLPTVCVAWPRAHVEKILAFAERRRFPPAKTADDGNLAKWMLEEHIVVYATVPSLVNHPDMEPSLVGTAHWRGMNPARVAACWTGRDFSPIELDWER